MAIVWTEVAQNPNATKIARIVSGVCSAGTEAAPDTAGSPGTWKAMATLAP